MSRTAAPPQPLPEPGVPESVDGAPAGSVSGPTLVKSSAVRAGQPGVAGGRGAAAVDEPDDWDQPTPDSGEEDQSLDAPEDDAQAQVPFC